VLQLREHAGIDRDVPITRVFVPGTLHELLSVFAGFASLQPVALVSYGGAPQLLFLYHTSDVGYRFNLLWRHLKDLENNIHCRMHATVLKD
jgi:hypothetical protein